MHPRAQSSLLWGVIAALAFLVLAQGYELLAAPGINPFAKLGVAVVVGIVAAGASYAFEEWLRRSERS